MAVRSAAPKAPKVPEIRKGDTVVVLAGKDAGKRGTVERVVRRSVKFHAHDEGNAANVGDVVRIVETRPLSATKHWRLVEIVEVAK